MTLALQFHTSGPHWGLMRGGFMDAVRALPPPPMAFFAAAVVFAALALAGQSAGWLRGSADPATIAPTVRTPAQPKNSAEREAARAYARYRCGNCGVVQSIRRVEPVGNEPASFEFIVRLRDGSTRTSSAASASKWHEGDRVLLIGGAKSTDH